MKNLKQFREDSGYAAKIKAKKELKLKKGTTLKIMPQVPEKPDKALGVKESKESCGEGKYYCFDEKKCKPIPKGHHVMPDGMLMKGETHKEGAAWTKKSGKNKEGGLNEKGRKSYERENPGSDLKAPSKKKGNKRRASFCARMKGRKKKLTSKKTANDPDSRINKSLRAWNC